MTSSPGPIPAASIARCSALVPLFTAIASDTPAVSRELSFKIAYLFSQDILGAFENTQHRFVDFRLDGLVLCPQI